MLMDKKMSKFRIKNAKNGNTMCDFHNKMGKKSFYELKKPIKNTKNPKH